MALALFDMDHTLVDGDVPSQWFDFLIERGLIEEKETRQESERLLKDYVDGVLNFHYYMLFELNYMRTQSMEDLITLRNDFFREKIRHLITDNATLMVKRHKEKGDKTAIITATNRFLAEPVAAMFGVDHLFATEPAVRENRFTGNFEGVPCFQGGKVQLVKSWCAENNINQADSYGYSDSFNDLPLLEWVEHPIAVDPDNRLKAYAEKHGWKITSKLGTNFDI